MVRGCGASTVVLPATAVPVSTVVPRAPVVAVVLDLRAVRVVTAVTVA